MTDQRTDHAPPRETLSGDRLCMQCLHPLAGRAIERDAQTGLLYVRCGECGTASALFEYPTGAPWLNRMKSVIATTLVASLFAVVVALGLITGGFTVAVSENASGECATSVEKAYRQDPLVKRDETSNLGPWTEADLSWLATETGKSALAAARWDIGVWMVYSPLALIGLVLATPFAMLLGVIVMRRSRWSRLVVCALPAMMGCAFPLAIALLWTGGIRTFATPTWSQVTEAHYSLHFATLVSVLFIVTSAVIGLTSPAIVATICRFILPPRDRRLVAWVWEWRGKPVPKR